MKTARWELRLTPAELEEWKARAAEAGMLVSDWVRSRCNGEVAAPVVEAFSYDDPAREVPMPPVVSNCSFVREVKSAVKGKTCVHGTEKAHRCWQCGGLAKI